MLALAGALLAAVVQLAHASCGASFCSVNTQWESQGAWTESGVMLDLRYEYMDQNQERSGTKKTEPAGVPDTTDELNTLNRNLIAGIAYTINPSWGISAQLPFVDRDHSHIVNSTIPEYESWHLEGIGDLRVNVLHPFAIDHGTVGVQVGLKLPTGKFNEVNSQGVLAERSLQPGTGTTDALLGAYYNAKQEGGAATLFTQFVWQRPFDQRDGYAPGQRFGLDIGLGYALTHKAKALLQLNMLAKDRDQGINAEPDESGGQFVFISPGLSYLLTSHLQLYGFVQLPLYQYVNGTQLTADWSAVAGLSWKM
jgi:hypothetical protein